MSGAHPSVLNPNFKHLKNVSITIFITNFPAAVSSKDLWKLYERHGVVADVYIARKLSKSGRRFGFIRFIKSPDQATLLEDLNKIWIGSYHLFAAVARSERHRNTRLKQPNQVKPNLTKPQPTNHSSQAMGARSFASILSGNIGNQKEVLAGTFTKSITLENSDLLDLSDNSNVVLAKVKNVHLIINIHSVLKKEGFSDFKCRYMGGLWLWIEFSDDDSRLKFENKKELEWYFTKRNPVSHNFFPDDRMTWIEIEGLPLNAWTVNAFKRVAGNWGETIFLDDDAEENIATGRVCIKTKIKTHILDSCLFSIKGVNYQVRVREFANWVPKFDLSDNTSQHDHVSEASNNDQNLHRTNELEDEEGEVNAYWAHNIELMDDKSTTDSIERKEDKGPTLDGGLEHEEPFDVNESEDENNDSDSSSEISSTSRLMREVDVRGVYSDHVDSFEEGEIIGDSVLNNDGCVKDCMEKNMDDDVGKEIPVNDSSIASPPTPPGTDLILAQESCSTWLDYVGPLITDELDSEKRWNYRDPKGNIQGSFSLAQLRMWKDYFPSDLKIWSYYGNEKETILLHSALKRRTNDAS